ncbi:hypothetical protein [Allopusillimonas ginsengisoli]|uniref:hypothetical protein n=1 Tax=Allopusillimonas ginsengisoli TaxID=453575 RepID=UPI00101FFD3E|nr:hypothetical protein [Allopusillimonas ginsengisoli]TEA78637.1 hypothetical protein ERE07_09580 [Allopusillimonas ginsengisoli]
MNQPFGGMFGAPAIQPQQPGLLGMAYSQPAFGGLLGGRGGDEKTQYEQMASPYAQWAAQQLAQVAPQAQPEPVQQPQIDPRQQQQNNLWNYYNNSSYNNS